MKLHVWQSSHCITRNAMWRKSFVDSWSRGQPEHALECICTSWVEEPSLGRGMVNKWVVFNVCFGTSNFSRRPNRQSYKVPLLMCSAFSWSEGCEFLFRGATRKPSLNLGFASQTNHFTNCLALTDTHERWLLYVKPIKETSSSYTRDVVPRVHTYLGLVPISLIPSEINHSPKLLPISSHIFCLLHSVVIFDMMKSKQLK